MSSSLLNVECSQNDIIFDQSEVENKGFLCMK